MKTLLTLLALTLGVSAQAANKYSFVNSKYIDENTSWSEIATTSYYQIKSPVQYNVNGTLVDGMNTCQKSGKLFAPVASPVFGQGSHSGVVGTVINGVEVPAVASTTICKFIGAHSSCIPQTVQVPQNLQFSFAVPVLAIRSIADSGTIIKYWGVAFTKTFVVPDCN